ncbi:nuclear receptor-binding protein 2-like [Hyla sarda]|uniref:nuclear receptor-binding protein 2-like n=1 Tax=Hyla sarda TaxID=327740 RepID=UPI0024C2383D|nr:nuclear receptor-binding protein 2-like [Hyla sarda]
MQDNLLEEKTKHIDPQAVMASVPRRGQAPVLWRYTQVSSMELDKFLEDVRNGIYPLMNFAVSRPHVLPRALSQSQEDLQTTKTPTPEPLEVETRKIIQMHCNLERREDKARIHLTLYLTMEDKLHRHLSCDLLPNESSQTLASELVHYGFISEDDCQKMANFLEDALHKHRPPLN